MIFYISVHDAPDAFGLMLSSHCVKKNHVISAVHISRRNQENQIKWITLVCSLCSRAVDMNFAE